MIKCEVIKGFTLKDFDKLRNIVRYNKDEKGKLFLRDIFECDENMAEYLTGKNFNKDIVVKIIEVMPEETSLKDDPYKDYEIPRKVTKKKTSKKK